MGLFDRSPVVPVLRFNGPIGMATPLRPGLSLATTAGPIEKAFSMKKAPAVAIVINSPGGSPVQSRLIYQRIRDRAQESGKKVYVFAEDVAASGGYMIACAGDEIYADPSSIVGIHRGGLVRFRARQAYRAIRTSERRVHTIGKNKAMLDPFRPEEPKDVERLKAIQKDVHDVFTDLVKNSRGSKLIGEPDELFDGQIWCGARAVENGLIDGLRRCADENARGVWRKNQIESNRPAPRPFRFACRSDCAPIRCNNWLGQRKEKSLARS